MCLLRYQEWQFRQGVSALIYRADFDLAAAAVLKDARLRVFQAHFYHAAGWQHGARILGVDRGYFFHWVYQTEERIGQELYRRGIFPLTEYFNPAGRIGSPRGRWGEINF